jgi:hypothetical protein
MKLMRKTKRWVRRHWRYPHVRELLLLILAWSLFNTILFVKILRHL